ncbi:E3 ubiquitin-protein ligase RNF135 isoform X2 [Pleurodeles waltl]|uniref:E3 ubiquitin-protein ligase RNF135 isoform X2 n=1 Tax=Pleurodeles waltl TaxID=8319 RepID=UPI0037099F3A
MATSTKETDSELDCPICYNLFSVPTTLPCGHTFCMGCLEKHWRSGVKEYKCPVCCTVYKKKPKLSKSTTIAKLVERQQPKRGNGEPWCRDCAGERVERFCLTCGYSYCVTHLARHRSGDHLLLRPLSAEVQWPCREHDQPLQLYCPLHEKPLCAPCAAQQHADCKPVPLRPQLQIALENCGQRIIDIGKNIKRKEEDIQKRRNESSHIQKYVSEIKSMLSSDFRAMIKYIEEQEKAMLQRIDYEEQLAQQKIIDSVTILTVELAKQQKIKTCLEQAAEENWLGLLKDTQKAKEIDSASVLPVEDISLDETINTLTCAVVEVKELLLGNKSLEKYILPVNSEQSVRLSPSPGSSSPLAPTSNPDTNLHCMPNIKPSPFSQYAVDLSFDPQTVSCYLRLAQENRVVIVSDVKCSYAASPVRFINNQLLCSESFSDGCIYWEIITKNSEGWAVGITDRKISKKEGIGRTKVSWCLEWSNTSLSAWHENQQTKIGQQKPESVGVYLDCEKNSVSFYSVADDFTLLHTYTNIFSFPVFPAFWLYGLNKGGYLSINSTGNRISNHKIESLS